MGRYDLRPARVRQSAAMLLSSRRITQQPPWFQIMHDVPPSEMLVRTQPVQHVDPPKNRKVRKASRLFQPQRIVYQEDELRQEFFGDHPWELARPRVIVENNGKDHEKWDWSRPYQAGRPINGESVVQRQKWLMAQPQPRTQSNAKQTFMSKDKAYDIARKELYEQRHLEEVEARIAREEALASGAYFGANKLEVGMELEKKTFDQWKEWAKAQVVLMEQARNAAYTGLGTQTGVDEVDSNGEENEDSDPLNTAADLLGASGPSSKPDQRTKGRGAARP